MADESTPEAPKFDPAVAAGPGTQVHLALLGGSSVLVDNQVWVGRAAQNRRLAVLVVLACAPSRRMTRSSIQALLWPDADLESARRLLNEAVYVVRKELGGHILETRGDYLALGPSVTVDVEAFRTAIAAGELERALNGYSGLFLGTWAPADMPEFERWSALERETLARQHRDCVYRLAAVFEAVGDWSHAVERYQQLLDVDRFSVQATVGLARAFAAMGEPLRALRTIDAMASLWREEFGEQMPASLTVIRQELLSTSGSVIAPRVTPAPSTPVEEVALALPVESPTEGPAVSHEHTIVEGAERTILSFKRDRLLAGGAVLAIVAALTFGLGFGQPTPERVRASRIAIAPFDVAPADSGIAFVATGLSESLAGSLGTLTGLQLIAPEALTRNAGTLPPLDSIARRFGSPLLLRGTVERARDEISVTVRIIDSRTGEQVASSVTTTSPNQLGQLRRNLSLVWP